MLFIVKINYVIYTYYTRELEVTSNVKRRLDDVVKRKLERVNIILVFELDLTLIDCKDYTNYIKDKESSISLIFFFLVNEFDYVYVKYNVSSIFIT